MSIKYVKGAAVKKQYGISTQTLHKWSDDGSVRTLRTPGGNRMYSIEDIEKVLHVDESNNSRRKKVCYARVSSSHQEEDLKRQIELLGEYYPEHEIIKDIGSGINFKRRGLNSLLERVYSREIEEIVVLHKDRLCRFGYELIEFICKQASCKILVHGAEDEDESENSTELTEDLMSIITVFVARHNGLRSAKHRKDRQKITSRKVQNDKIIS